MISFPFCPLGEGFHRRPWQALGGSQGRGISHTTTTFPKPALRVKSAFLLPLRWHALPTAGRFSPKCIPTLSQIRGLFRVTAG